MAATPLPETSPDLASVRPHRKMLLGPRLRRLILRGVIVVAVFLALVAALTLVFGVSMLQYTFAGLTVSAIVIVAAIGLTLLYGIKGFANFAYGEFMTLGAYVALFVNLAAGFALAWGAIFAFVALAGVGILLEIAIFSRLEGRGPVAPLVASVGVALIINNGIIALAGTEVWNYNVAAIQDIPIVPGLGLPPVRGILTIAIGLSFVASTHILLKYTNLGKAMRATADNLELAKATGIDTKRVTYATWAISSSFAAAAGVLLGLGTVVSPSMGAYVLLLIFAAVIVGGIGSPYGAMLGALIVGLSQEMAVPFLLWLGSSDGIGLEHATAYKVAIPFAIMIGVLLLRPWGIAGRRPAIAPRAFLLERLSRVLARKPTLADVVEGNRRNG